MFTQSTLDFDLKEPSSFFIIGLPVDVGCAFDEANLFIRPLGGNGCRSITGSVSISSCGTLKNMLMNL